MDKILSTPPRRLGDWMALSSLYSAIHPRMVDSSLFPSNLQAPQRPPAGDLDHRASTPAKTHHRAMGKPFQPQLEPSSPQRCLSIHREFSTLDVARWPGTANPFRLAKSLMRSICFCVGKYLLSPATPNDEDDELLRVARIVRVGGIPSGCAPGSPD